MKIISLVSSYRIDGNTNRIVSLIEKQLMSIADKENVILKIERIPLGQLDLKTCRGCRVCFDKGEEKCPLKDEVLSIRDKMLLADGILAASPIYVEDVNGIMKNWIDRMAFNCHRPAFAGKSAYIATTSGIGSSNHAINTIKTAFSTWGMYITGKSRFRTGELMELSTMESKHGKEIRNAAEALFDSIKENAASKPSFYSLLTFIVQQKYWIKWDKYHDTMDYKYWHDSGWLESNCNYYIPHQANFLKVKIAQFVGRIVAVFFI